MSEWSGGRTRFDMLGLELTTLVKVDVYFSAFIMIQRLVKSFKD